MLPSSRYIRCAGYEIHCTEWGAPEAPVVIAWHGLARTGRDMDPLHARSAGRVWSNDTGHDLMLTAPEAVAAMLDEIAGLPASAAGG